MLEDYEQMESQFGYVDFDDLPIDDFAVFLDLYFDSLMDSSISAIFEDSLGQPTSNINKSVLDDIVIKYSEWVITSYMTGSWSWVDVESSIGYLYFLYTKPHKFPYRDIQAYTFDTLKDFGMDYIRHISTIIDPVLTSEHIAIINTDISRGYIELFAPRSGLLPSTPYYILSILTTDAAVKYGKNTTWCTAKPGNGMFRRYKDSISVNREFYHVYRNGKDKFSYYYGKMGDRATEGLNFFNADNVNFNNDLFRVFNVLPFMRDYIVYDFLNPYQKQWWDDTF
jgi:hypothetical protein